MRTPTKAIGYVCDIPIPRTDLVIRKEDQRARILKYAEQENLELVCIFEDEEFTEDCTQRPGVRKLFDCKESYDVVLVERAWCLSRRMKDLKAFIEKLDTKGAQLMASSYLWDCVSQHLRHHYRQEKKRKEQVAGQAREAA
jgi:DNA invertase Pin-like site-specific DNA recombinase